MVKLDNIRLKCEYYEDLIFDLTSFAEKIPCSLLRLIYEKTVIPDVNQMILFGRLTV